MRGKKISTALLLLAVLAALTFIWGNSLDSAVESAAKSGRVRELLRPLLELVVGQGGVTDHLVRKLAHFTEYAVLGALLLLLTAVGFRVRLQTVVNCLFFLMAAALTDETIQIFTGRGPQIQDVWLDFAGGFTGLLDGFAIGDVEGVIHGFSNNSNRTLYIGGSGRAAALSSIVGIRSGGLVAACSHGRAQYSGR